MTVTDLPIPDSPLNLIVKSMTASEEESATADTVLPFFADGYPGLVYYASENGLTIRPHTKQLPPLFLYGQTVHPVELVFSGSFKLMICQLYPFVLRSLFGVSATAVTDNCYNPATADACAGKTLEALQPAATAEERASLLYHFLLHRFANKKEELDFKIRQAINLIINEKGQRNIGAITKQLKINPRTLERRFQREVGIGAKQFSRIIQFQQSLLHLNAKRYAKLTEVVYENGYADHSHFIKVFKAFTNETPSGFLKK